MANETAQPEHIENRIEKIGQGAHQWYQKGNQIICEGNLGHYRHAAHIPAHVVLAGTKQDGEPEFRNLKEKGGDQTEEKK